MSEQRSDSGASIPPPPPHSPPSPPGPGRPGSLHYHSQAIAAESDTSQSNAVGKRSTGRLRDIFEAAAAAAGTGTGTGVADITSIGSSSSSGSGSGSGPGPALARVHSLDGRF
jgi:hypothetical protein